MPLYNGSIPVWWWNFLGRKVRYFNLCNYSLSENVAIYLGGYFMYGVRNLDMSIRFSLKSRPSEGIPRPEISQIKAEISLHTNLKLIFHKNVGWQGYQWIP